MTPIENSESSSLENNKAGLEPKKDVTPKKAGNSTKEKKNENKTMISGIPEEGRLKKKKKKKAKQINDDKVKVDKTKYIKKTCF